MFKRFLINMGISRREVIKKGGMTALALTLPIPLLSFTKLDFMKDKKQFEVIIIGGSYAGLSAAMALGRSLRNVLIIDSGKPCNRYTPHSHNFITHDGAVPNEINIKAKEQVLKYKTVKFHEDVAIQGKKTETGFEISTESGETFSAKKLVFATGVKDIFPAIKGFEECWGKSVIHCPYCHGYEFKDQKTVVLANGERAFHVTALVNNLTHKLVIVTQGKADFKEEQLAKLKKNNIELIEKEVIEIQHQNGEVNTLIFKDGARKNVNAIYASIPFGQHCTIPIDLGCEKTEIGHIKVDMFQKTTVPGVFACGDNSTMMRSVSYAIATGGIVGSMVNNELTMENF